MNRVEFRYFLNLMMVCDPCPIDPAEDYVLRQWANEEARRHGYSDWIDAYHRHDKKVVK